VISLMLGGLLVVALPSLTSNVMGFGETVVDKVGVIQERLHSIPLLRNLDLSHFRSWAASAIASLLPALGSATASIVTGLLLSAYFILDGAALLHRITKLLPPEPGARLERTLQKAGRRMRHWLAGQAMLMAILGTAATVTFGLMSLPDFYLLGILAGVANIVPLIGPLLTVVIAGAVALTVSPWHLLGVVIFYLVYQQVENAFLTPKIMKSQVSLSSAVIIAALLIGGELAGIAGALVAVPSAVLVAELASEYLIYERGPADERTDEAPEGTPD
jgi:predicted PurR-regulated permease PerM